VKNKIIELLKPWEEPKHSGRTICPADLLILTRLIDQIGAKKVIEFGCGVTTQEMTAKGVGLTTFSLEVSHPIKPDGIEFVKCNLKDPDVIERVRNELEDTDLLVIDAEHTYAFAKMYHENYIRFYDGPIWIHDYFEKSLTGEQKYLDQHVIGRTHKKILMMDLPHKTLREISNEIDYNLCPWNRKKTKKKTACLCCVVLERM